MAYAAVDLEIFLSLVGSFTCTFLCLVFPPLLDIITFWDKMGKLRLAKNLVIILSGVFVFVTGTVAAVLFLVDYFEHYHSQEGHYEKPKDVFAAVFGR